MKPDLDTSHVIIAVALPPPLHGQSMVNLAVVERLRRNPRTQIIDLSPRTFQRGLLYHLRRVISVLETAVRLVITVFVPNKTFYTVVEAGSGMIYTSFLVLIA